MDNLKKHGQPPYQVVVVHGGPGAAGDVQDLAKELSKDFGVLEPYQTKDTIAGQIAELKEVIEKNGQPPIILIGHSWGAILCYIFTSTHPDLVTKLILISSAVFDHRYTNQIAKIRRQRLTRAQQQEITKTAKILNNPKTKNKDALYAQFGKLITEADAYNLLPGQNEITPNYAISQSIWPEFTKLRKSGELLELGRRIKCPVLAIHGNYDPRPAEGIKTPLSSTVKDFKFILLKNCGHYPWREAEAREQFYQIVENEL